jgi:murein DD-endopeptidase MepM/ murein hydrolase activator NlpD
MAIKFNQSKYKVLASNLSLAVTLISSFVLGFYFYHIAFTVHKETDEIVMAQDQKMEQESVDESDKNLENILPIEQKLRTPFGEQILANELLPRRILSQRVSRGATEKLRKTEDEEKFLWPTPGHYNITSHFGMRVHPIYKDYRMHTGLDTTAPAGADIVAVMDGIVTLSQFDSSYGNRIIIDHGNGISTVYAHNKNSFVVVGQAVERGQVIAHVGSTGLSTGPHAHFEVLIHGTPVDPLPYLR